jgi:hypothetical protein
MVKKCAYVTLVMKGDEYVIGALVLAKCLRMTRTKHVIACMITDDLSDDAKRDLCEAFDRVHVVDYYKAKAKPLRTQAQRGMYESWMSISLTWYQSLNLVQYSKVLLLDSDLAIFRNMDHLFELQTPAGSFHNFHKPLRFYRGITHGSTVSARRIMQALANPHGVYVCIGNGLLLSPSRGAFRAFDRCMKQLARRQGGAVGFTQSLSGTNEQMIAYFYASHNIDWTNIGTQYQIIPWKKVKNSKEPPYLFHFFNTKPWRMDLTEWPDLQVWWRFAKILVRDTPEAKEYIPRQFQHNLDEIEKFAPHFCFWCGQHGHTFISPECKIECQQFLDNK